MRGGGGEDSRKDGGGREEEVWIKEIGRAGGSNLVFGGGIRLVVVVVVVMILPFSDSEGPGLLVRGFAIHDLAHKIPKPDVYLTFVRLFRSLDLVLFLKALLNQFLKNAVF